ncbi:MAG: hypothetical protein K2P51_01410 [Rhabdochlamydiaceae bacterium]|nr:hypothetical protein [Rhabdochlamydiaceae bacterium]
MSTPLSDPQPRILPSFREALNTYKDEACYSALIGGALTLFAPVYGAMWGAYKVASIVTSALVDTLEVSSSNTLFDRVAKVALAAFAGAIGSLTIATLLGLSCPIHKFVQINTWFSLTTLFDEFILRSVPPSD